MQLRSSVLLALAALGCSSEVAVIDVQFARGEADQRGFVSRTVVVRVDGPPPVELSTIRTTCGCLKVGKRAVTAGKGGTEVTLDIGFQGLLPQGDRQQALLEFSTPRGPVKRTVCASYPPREAARFLRPAVTYVPCSEPAALEFFDIDPVTQKMSAPVLLTEGAELAKVGVQLVSFDVGDGCEGAPGRLNLVAPASPATIELLFRLSNGDVVPTRVFVQGDAGKVWPKRVVSAAGDSVGFSASSEVLRVESDAQKLAFSKRGSQFQVQVAEDCPAGEIMVSVQLSGQESPEHVRVTVVPLSGENGRPPQAAVDNRADIMWSALASLYVSRAEYHVERDRVNFTFGGSVPIVDIVTRSLSQSGSEAMAGLLVKEIVALAAEQKVAMETFSEKFEISIDPTAILRKYVDFMPGIDLTERPLYDLYTGQYRLWLTVDKRVGGVAHLLHRQAYILHYPDEILSPCPVNPEQVNTIRMWAAETNRLGSSTVTKLRPTEGGGTGMYEIYVRDGDVLPSAVRLVRDSVEIAAVIEWGRSASGVYPSRVGRLRRQGQDYTVELIKIGNWSSCPPTAQCVLRTDVPKELLDQRAGIGAYQEFEEGKLPSEVRAHIHWIGR